METVKIRNVKNHNIIKEVKKELASDYIGTGEFELYIEKIKEIQNEKPVKNIKNTKNEF